MTKILVVLATLTPSTESQAEGIRDLTDKSQENPAGQFCYDSGDMSRISDYAKGCEGAKMDLKTMNQQYNQCLEQSSCEEKIIGSQMVFWASVTTAFVAGIISGVKVVK